MVTAALLKGARKHSLPVDGVWAESGQAEKLFP